MFQKEKLLQVFQQKQSNRKKCTLSVANLKKNILYNFFYQILILIIPFITAPYLSRVIGPTGVGTYSFAYSVALYFTYITMLGLNNYGNRSIAITQNNIEKRSSTFCEIYSMQIIAFCISIFAYLIYILFFSVDKTAAIIMGIFVLSALFDINWFFFGMELFKLTVTRNTIIKIGTAICIFIFVKQRSDVYKYVFIMAISVLLSQICLWPFLKQYVKFSRPSLRNVLKHFKPNLILFIPAIAVSLYKILDKVMLGYMSSMTEVGYFENAEKIINIALSLITAVGTVMLPRMTALISNNKTDESRMYIDKSMLLVLAYSNAAAFGIMAIGKLFSVVYYGGGFEETGIIMILLAVTIIFIGGGNVVRTQYLIPSKHDNIYIKSAIIGAIVNIIINIFLIPIYSAVGAAIATIVAEFCVLFYQLFSIRKELNLKKYVKYEIGFALIGIIMVLAIKLLPKIESDTISLLMQIVVGGIVYVILAGIYIIKIEYIRIPLPHKK